MQSKTFFYKLRELRIAHKLTYKDMGKMLGLSTTHYWQIENKKRGLYYQTAKKIANIFHMKPDEIFYQDYQ